MLKKINKSPLEKQISKRNTFVNGGMCFFFLWVFQVYGAYGFDPVRVVGSTAIFPFSSLVAERLSLLEQGKEGPIIERTGTGAGIKFFCGGMTSEFPQIVNASRKIKVSEKQNCLNNGVSNILEIKIGYGGIIIATASNNRKEGKVFSCERGLTLDDLYKGLAKNVYHEGKWIPNPYNTWKEIRECLPDIPIVIFGPPFTSGVRDSIKELIIDPFCTEHSIKECFLIREDGRYIEVPENTKLVIQKLEMTPEAIGILSYPFWEQNQKMLNALSIESIKPSLNSIFSASYPLTRVFYLYVKKEPTRFAGILKQFLEEFLSEEVWSEEGALACKGLIPPSKEVREKTRKALQQF